MLSLEYIKTKQEVLDIFDFTSKLDGEIVFDEDFQIHKFKPSYMAWSKEDYCSYHINEGLIEVCKNFNKVVGVSCFKKEKFLKTITVQKILAIQDNYETIIKTLINSRISNIRDQSDVFNNLAIKVDDINEKLMKLLNSLGFSSKIDKITGQFNFTKEFKF